MPVSSCDVLLQIEQPNGDWKCTGFRGVPAATRSWICVASAGSPLGRQTAAELGQQLAAALTAASPDVRVEEVDCPGLPATLDPAAHPDWQKLLVLLAAPDRRLTGLSWYENWESDEHAAAVMTVLPSPDLLRYLDPAITDDSHLLRRINAIAWSGNVGEVIPALLSRARVTMDAARVFLSYRRAETEAMARQLFDQLTHEGFAVFLDRFSIPPGYDFQRRLNQELEDKSMLLLLESCSLKDSRWTQHEIDFAKRYRLGLACVRMPDVKPADVLASVASRPRLTLSLADFTAPPAPACPPYPAAWPELTPDAAGRVVTFLKQEHAAALFDRRRRMRHDVWLALAGAGVAVDYTPVGPLRVRTGCREHLIWVTTRPPGVDDFRALYAARQRVAGEAAVVGPQAALEPDSRQRLTWLAGRSGCPAFDEGKLADFARCVAGWT